VNAPAQSLATAWLVILAAVVAALQVGKLPPALPALQAELDLSLVQSGFLLSMVQMAGMLTAIVVGSWADRSGLKRAMVAGMLTLALASALGSRVHDAGALMLLRAVEGMGFLWVALPAPALLRRLVPPARMARLLGVWSAYTPLGTALALLAGPLFIPWAGWHAWWDLFAALSAVMAVWLYRVLPSDPPRSAQMPGLSHGLVATLGRPGPWLASSMFCVYSAQWLAMMGFLPSIYAQAGVSGLMLGVLTAAAAAANIVGNVASGRLLHAGYGAHRLLWWGYAAMALGSAIAFSTATEGWPWLRYAGVLLFSSVGGLVPATLFSLAVRLAPSEQQIATSVGWVQQWSATGQFFGPPLVAWVAAQSGGWHFTHVVTGSLCALGAILAWVTSRHLAHGAARD
jgi:MFS family permease